MRLMSSAVLAILLAFSPQVMAEKTEFKNIETESDWKAVLASAEAAGKPIFIDIYTDWCGWCKVMDRETFSDKKVGAYMNATFISVKLDAETGIGSELGYRYEVDSYPTFLVVNAKEKLVAKESGYMEPEPFLETLRGILQGSAEMGELEEKYDTDEISDEELMQLAVLYAQNEMDNDAEAVAKKVLDKTEVPQLHKIASAEFLGYFTHMLPMEDQRLVVSQMQSKNMGTRDNFMNMLSRNIYGACADKDRAQLDASLDLLLAPATAPEDRKNVEARTILFFAETTSDWPLYATQTLLLKDNDLTDVIELTGFTYSILDNTEDKEALAIAMDLSNFLMEKDPDWASHFLKALALSKHDRIEEAKEFAQVAYDTCPDEGQREVVELLQKTLASN